MEPPPPPALEDLYDEDILARIDRQLGSAAAPGRAEAPAAPDGPSTDTAGLPGPADDTGSGPSATDAPPPAETPGTTLGEGVVPRYPVARRLGVGGAMLAGAMFGLGDLLEREGARQHIIDYVPDDVDESQQLVTFHYVRGDPGASRLVLRPWLLERLRPGRR